MFALAFLLLAGLGAFLRYYLGQSIVMSFPIATLLVNTIGSFIIGAAYSWQLARGQQPWLVLLTVAFLGSLTTFSSYALDTMKLFQSGFFGWALLNIFANNAIGVSLCYLGFRVFQ